MKFSLLNIGENGYATWLQDFIGTKQEADLRAKEIEKVNSDRIKVDVVDQVSSVVPILGLFKF